MDLDPEHCYRVVSSRDPRFDGTFYSAVRTTGIYCRPSCPAVTPRRANVTFFRTAAAAQRAGFRACRRCRPDATPGSPEWNVRGDLVGRVMRLVSDGGVERLGVPGVAAALGYSQRHVNRVVTEELGAGLLALARTQRAHTARILLESTDLPAADVAWAAGFGSVRSFNDTMAAVYGEPATAVRRRRGPASGDRTSIGAAARGLPGGSTPAGSAPAAPPAPGSPPPPAAVPPPAGGSAGPAPPPPPAPITVRLATRMPFDVSTLLAFLGDRAVTGLEDWDGWTYRRTLGLPHGHAVVAVSATTGGVLAQFQLTDLRDLAPGVARVRRLLDLDADPRAVAEVLGADPMLGPLVRARPGLRVAGGVDPHEVLVRAIVGQQVSVAGARTVVGRLVATFGAPLSFADPVLTRVFPEAAALAGADPTALSMPGSRGQTLVSVCAAQASGHLLLDPATDRGTATEALLAFRGIGPWTAAYVRMRGLTDPDVLLAGDLGVRHAVGALGGDARARAIEERAHAWRPWRSYAVGHLWASLSPPGPGVAGTSGSGPTRRGPGAHTGPTEPRAHPAVHRARPRRIT